MVDAEENKPFRNYHVTAAEQGRPLASALRTFAANRSWKQVKKLISQRYVQVNGNLCTDDTRKLKLGDVVKVWDRPLAKPVTEYDVAIRYVDSHLVVIEKPAGVTTLRHPEERHWPARRKQLQPTLEELLPLALARHLGWNVADRKSRAHGRTDVQGHRPSAREQRKSASRGSEELPKVRAVHRLDRDTSGLMVFARTATAETALIRLFSKHRIRRSYLAVVNGDVASQTIDNYLVRDRGDGLRGSTPLGAAAEGAQRAITRVDPIKRIGPYTVVRCRLQTGRTHQIRIHLSELGHPLCGERVYRSSAGGEPHSDESDAPRQALHAAELGFAHPITGERLLVQSALPADLKQWLGVLVKRYSL
jgi:23S rRNA pseudouridine1911/1915/1917 synthase